MGRKRAPTLRKSFRWLGRQPRRAPICVAGAGLALALLVAPTQGQTHVKGWGSRVFDSAWNEGAVRRARMRAMLFAAGGRAAGG